MTRVIRCEASENSGEVREAGASGRGRAWRGLVLALGVALVPGCASGRVSFSPVDPAGELVDQLVIVVDDDQEGREASIALSARGQRRDERAPGEADTVRVEVVVDNRLEAPIELPAGSFALVDDADRAWELLEVEGPPAEGRGDTVGVPSGRRATLALIFGAGASEVLGTTGSVRLRWRYRFAGRAVARETRFLPAPRRRVVYGGAFGPGPFFPYRRFGGFGAYGPYGHPYWW